MDEFDILEFYKTPREIKQHLDEYVQGQELAKISLATAVAEHYTVLREKMKNGACMDPTSKPNVLLMGNSGTGKTYLVEILADYMGVPMITVDATSLTATGYVGKGVDIIYERILNLPCDTETSASSIVFIDEFDKLKNQKSDFKDVGGEIVQEELLKIIEGTVEEYNDPHTHKYLGTVDTTDMLFIFAGAFNGLEEKIKKRLNVGKVGFSEKDFDINKNINLIKPTFEDLVKYGFSKQILGRIPHMARLHDISENDAYEIIKKESCKPIRSKQYAFNGFGINLIIHDKAKKELAKQAIKFKTNARGINGAVETLLNPFLFNLADRNIKNLVINSNAVTNPETYLDKLVKKYSLVKNPKVEITKINSSLEIDKHRREEFLWYRSELIEYDIKEKYLTSATLHLMRNLEFKPEEIVETIPLMETRLKNLVKEYELNLSEEKIDEMVCKCLETDMAFEDAIFIEIGKEVVAKKSLKIKSEKI